MKDRVQVADLSQVQLRPEARGGDTYYRPQADPVQQQADPMLVQLAEGLGKMQPKLMELGMHFLDKQNKEEAAQGNQAYRDALMKDADLNKKGFKDLVDQGVIPAGASPWFQKGWREQQLRNMGEEYGRDVTLAWNANGDLKNSDDPGKLNQFLAQQSQTFREKIKASGSEFRPAELAEVLDPILDHYNHNVGQQHVQFRVSEIEKEVDTNSRLEVGKWAKRVDLSMEERAAGIQGAMDDLYKKGLPGSRSREIMAEAVMDAAATAKDPSMLGLLDHLKTGTATLSSDTKVRAKMDQTQQHIDERLRNDQRWQWSVEEHDYHEKVTKPRAELSWKFTMQQHQWANEQHNRSEQERTLNAALGDEIRQDPTQDLRKSESFQKLSKMDPMKAQQMLHFQQVYLGAGEDVKSDDPNSVFQITKDLYTGSDDPNQLRVRAANAFTHGLVSRKTYEHLSEQIFLYQEGSKDPLLSSQEMRALTDGVYRGVIKSPEYQFGNGAVIASQAVTEFHGWARNWSKDNPGASLSEFRIEAQKRAAELVAASNSFIDVSKLTQQQDATPAQKPALDTPRQAGIAGMRRDIPASSQVPYTPEQLKQMDRGRLPKVITDLMRDPNNDDYLRRFREVYGYEKPIGHWLRPLYPTPSEAAMRYLVDHPETAPDFNRKFGPGASDEMWNRIDMTRQ